MPIEKIKEIEEIEDILSLKGCLRVLIILNTYKKLRFNEIMKKTLLPSGTLTRALKLLIQKGYVKYDIIKIKDFRHPICVYYYDKEKFEKLKNCIYNYFTKKGGE
ncbi:MAG: helix-turn-helix domain-containing protein [Candidatus Aenigmatarchaeota archaeon]